MRYPGHMADEEIPEYEKRARRHEAEAERLRSVGRHSLPRSETVDVLYELLGIDPAPGRDQREKKRREALVDRVKELLEIERSVNGSVQDTEQEGQGAWPN